MQRGFPLALADSDLYVINRPYTIVAGFLTVRVRVSLSQAAQAQAAIMIHVYSELE